MSIFEAFQFKAGGTTYEDEEEAENAKHEVVWNWNPNPTERERERIPYVVGAEQ